MTFAAVGSGQFGQQGAATVSVTTHGVGNFIASVITSTVGGAMSQYTGGKNLALDELDRKTQQRIDAQKADIANQWQGVAFKRNRIRTLGASQGSQPPR